MSSSSDVLSPYAKAPRKLVISCAVCGGSAITPMCVPLPWMLSAGLRLAVLVELWAIDGAGPPH